MRFGRTDHVYAALRKVIEAGEYPVGAALPTQPELARRFGVSTVTLRTALAQLQREGFIAARRGSGTYVTAQQPSHGVVLVVDDDPTIRSLLADALDALGYQAELAADGASALALVAQRRFTHVLLDVRMPGISGTETAERITQLDSNPVIVFVTGYPGDTFAGAVSPRWPLLILRKPFELSELARVLRMRVA